MCETNDDPNVEHKSGGHCDYFCHALSRSRSNAKRVSRDPIDACRQEQTLPLPGASFDADLYFFTAVADLAH